VLLAGLAPDGAAPPEVFGQPPSPARHDLMVVMMDQLNREYGRGTVRLAAAGLNKPWALKADRHAPRTKTCSDELPTAD
jgi:DNA polymerase V